MAGDEVAEDAIPVYPREYERLKSAGVNMSGFVKIKPIPVNGGSYEHIYLVQIPVTDWRGKKHRSLPGYVVR